MTFDKSIIIKEIKEVSKKNGDILAAFNNAFEGRTVLVISAGPSAKEWSKIYDKIRHTSPVIVCVKQSIELDSLYDICDIHFINPYNLKKYKSRKDTLVIFTDALDAPKVFNKYDVKFCVEKDSLGTLETSLSKSLNFANFKLSNSGKVRPWGPGIMYESVFYTLVHMGVKEIHTVGWDVANREGDNVHYYDEKDTKLLLKINNSKVSKRLKSCSFYNFICYHFSRKYNGAGMVSGEAELVSQSIPSLKAWLREEGVELKVHSNSVWHKD